MSDLTPPSADWSLIVDGAFENLTGPMYKSSKDLGADEPIRTGFRVEAKHCNSSNFLHGGMMAMYLDCTLGRAMLTATKAESNSPTMTLTVDYLAGSVLGDWIESRVRMIHTTYRTAYCDVLALGPKGPVARANGIFRLARPKQA